MLSAPPSDTANVGFTGHYATDTYGLVNMGGRQYDARIGVFTTADPFVTAPFFRQAYNRYAYAYNNPLGYVDPSGFDFACLGNECVVTLYPSDSGGLLRLRK